MWLRPARTGASTRFSDGDDLAQGAATHTDWALAKRAQLSSGKQAFMFCFAVTTSCAGISPTHSADAVKNVDVKHTCFIVENGPSVHTML